MDNTITNSSFSITVPTWIKATKQLKNTDIQS